MILSREFGLTQGPPPVRGGDCSTVRAEWKSWVAGVSIHRERSFRRFSSAAKSCNRLFDVKCSRCDRAAACHARRLWDEHVSMDCDVGDTVSGFYAERLKRNVRELVSGWGERLESCRFVDSSLGDSYIPDQQGCLETQRGVGGTLGTSPDDCTERPGIVRRGVAKTKGKFRVVTMQSARVKRVLRPVHNALYDHITSFGWCVRGEVKEEDFLAVYNSTSDDIISGDYQAATDNIFQSAVESIVEVFCEDPRLTSEERSVLRDSFSNLMWKSSVSGRLHPIKRGSMMGNLCSFPILCLINKACHDIAAEEVYGVGERRVGRFNGDDCLFGGNPAMYAKWRLVTSIFGLIVNEEKTEVSRRFGDLNSRCYDFERRSFVSKPVLSFLLPARDAPGEILSSVIEGIKSFQPAVQQWVVNVLMRYEISLRGITLSTIPSQWCKILVKRKWFRRCVWSGPGLVDDPIRGRDISFVEFHRPNDLFIPTYDRSFPTVVGPPPVPSALSGVERISALIAEAHTSAWLGVKVVPPSPRLDRVGFRRIYDSDNRPLPLTRFVGVAVRWGFLWPRVLFTIVSEEFPELLISDHDALVSQSLPYSSRFLVLRHSFRVNRPTYSYPVPPSLSPPPRHLGDFSLLFPLLERWQGW